MEVCLIQRVVAMLSLVISVAHSDIIVSSSDGGSVICVDKKKQPAFNNTLLITHKLQESPSMIPRAIRTIRKSKTQTTIEAYVSTAPCPEGTIPIRNDTIKLNDQTPADTTSYAPPGHEYATIITYNSRNIYGAKGTINVWDPTIEADEMSIAQMWVAAGAFKTKNLNTIETGWQVLPKVNGDSKPRFFIFWTSDWYSNGCYNLQCSGFIQISSSIVIGGAISPVSSFGGIQSEITILVWKDHLSGNWWLSLGSDHVLVGYWPAELFTSLADHAINAEWGGEVLNSNRFGRHTKIDMGSGRFPNEGFGKSSYIRNLETVDNNYSLEQIQDLKKMVKNPAYYSVRITHSDEWNTYMFYGGPGLRRSEAAPSTLCN